MNIKNIKTNKLPSRETETRAKTERRKPWSPPSQLDAPPAPAGFKHRWIRAESVGQMDQKNVSARLREVGNLSELTNILMFHGPQLIQVDITVS